MARKFKLLRFEFSDIIGDFPTVCDYQVVPTSSEQEFSQKYLKILRIFFGFAGTCWDSLYFFGIVALMLLLHWKLHIVALKITLVSLKIKLEILKITLKALHNVVINSFLAGSTGFT